MAAKRGGDDYDSAFEGDSFVPPTKRMSHPGPSRSKYKDPLLAPKLGAPKSEGMPSHAKLNDLSCIPFGQALRYHQSSLTAYDRHKMLINQYLLYHPGATKQFERDSSKDKRDMDVVREHHQFLWDTSDQPVTWEQKLAKKYYDKLFKEYCICDLSLYKENKIGMRWRTAEEVKSGRGQFTCSNKRCEYNVGLRSWEMNFAYVERGVKKNALVKLRLCEPCSLKLNYSRKRKEVIKKKRKGKKKRRDDDEVKVGEAVEDVDANKPDSPKNDEDSPERQEDDDVWKGPPKIVDERSQEDEFEEYLEDLLL